MKRTLGIFALLTVPFFAALGLSIATAQQPPADDIDIDGSGCSYSVEWIDGIQTSLKITISENGVVAKTITFDDTVGDQSAIVYKATVEPGTKVRAVLDRAGDLPDVVATFTVGACPTATPTSTNTPAPTATSTPAPTQTPVIIVIPAPTYTPVPTVAPIISSVRPPSTGDGGLLQ